jgi:hypothetical protein
LMKIRHWRGQTQNGYPERERDDIISTVLTAAYPDGQGLRRENETAYAASRMSISGSSDCSIPSVS